MEQLWGWSWVQGSSAVSTPCLCCRLAAVSVQVMLFCGTHSEGLHAYVNCIYSNTKLRIYPSVHG